MVRDKCAKNGKKLSGAVLIMVVTVMFVLIVMLLATLTVVSTAQNRYFTKYEENQAYYTARSALDSYVDNLLASEDYYAYDASGNVRKYSYRKADGTVMLATDPSAPELTQGLALELDLYRIKAHSDTYENYQALSDADKLNFTTDYWANPSGVFTADPEKSYYDDPDLDYIEYEVTVPVTSSDSTDYSKFVDTYDDSGVTKQRAMIKVEVLSRQFAGHDSTASTSDDMLAIRSASRSDDMMYIKVTSTAVLAGVEGTACAIYQIDIEPSGFKNALTSATKIIPFDNTTIIGGFAVTEYIQFGNQGGYIGNAYAGDGAYVQGGGSYVTLEKGAAAYFKGIEWQNHIAFKTIGLTSPVAADDTPIAYIDGQFKGNNSCTWAGGVSGTDVDRVNIVINQSDTTQPGLIAGSGTNWSLNADIICNGDMVINSNSFDVNGTVIINGDLYICSNNLPSDFSSYGQYYVNGDVYIGDSSNTNPKSPTNISCSGFAYQWDNINNLYSVYSTAGCSFASNAFDGLAISTVTTMGADIYLPELGMGNNISLSSSVRYVPIYESQYYEFLKRSDVAPYNFVTPYEYVTAEDWAFTSNSDREKGKYNKDGKTFSVPADAITISSGPGTVSVSGKKNYYLAPGNYGVNSGECLYITGTGTANIYLTPGYYQGKIRSSDSVKVNFYAPTGTYSWNVANYTDSVYAAIMTGNLRFGKLGSLPSPPIHFYMSAGTVWNATQAGWCLMTGYIYAPHAVINACKGVSAGFIGSSATYNYYYNNSLVTDKNGSAVTACPMFIGAVMAGRINGLDNNAVVAFIEESTGGVEAGMPVFEWKAVEYRNN